MPTYDRWARAARLFASSAFVLFLAAGAYAQSTSDVDADGVTDDQDNCLLVANGPNEASNQRDTDLDGFGDACDADYNNDGSTTTLDFPIFVEAITGASQRPETDHNGDGATTTLDFAAFMAGFGGPPGPSGLPCADPRIDVSAGDPGCEASDHEHPDDVLHQNEQEALAEDTALLAAGKQIHLDEATRAVDFQETFVSYARDVASRYPGRLSRIWMEPAPATNGFIEFIGQAPFDNTPSGVMLLSGGVFTRQEHRLRAELAAEALAADGLVNFATFFDVPNDVIKIEIVAETTLELPDPQRIFDVVRESIANAQELGNEARSVLPTDLDVRVEVRPGEIYAFEHSRGGNWLQDGGFRECTSGWSVDGPDGDGIITAAHCTGLDTFEEASGTTYSMTWRDQERGKGDVEYHTTSHIELAEFYATSSSIRDVESTKQTLWMLPGSSVCSYGRSSNVRDCTHDMEATGVTVTFTDGVTVKKLARASVDASIGGDSGGGWSWSTKAWGVHSGSSSTSTSTSGKSYFTPIRRAERELNVDVLLAP